MKEIVFEKGELINLESSLNKEIIETSSEGSFAITTLTNCNTRKYHGLYIAEQPKIDDEYHVFLSSIDETIEFNDFSWNLSLHRYPNETYYPKGHKYIENFELKKIPKTTYRIGDIILEKEFCFLNNNRLAIRYYLKESPGEVNFKINPFLAFRQRHSLSKHNTYADTSYKEVENGIKIRLYKNYDSLFMQFSKKPNYIHSPLWYYNFEYFAEAERGYDSHEDLITPGRFEFKLNKGEELFFIASLHKSDTKIIKDEFKMELESREELNSFDSLLRRAAKSFFVSKGKDLEIIAGYPWFGRWGRDSFISVVGLSIGLDNKDYFLRVIDTLIKDMKNGLFPNMGQAYNSVDAPLWFIWALQEYGEWTNEKKFIWNKYKKEIIRVIDSYKNGDNEGIRMLENGLIYSYIENKALTWMDAIVEGSPVTQRKGICVEINSLWYNAIKFTIEIAELNSDTKDIKDYYDIADKIEGSFKDCFWSKERGYLADVVDGNYKDFSVRPNMIFSTSLKYSCLSDKIKSLIIERVKKELFIPYGIRTLSPTSKEYKDRYFSSQENRDRAYHQGISWPWLLGHFVQGHLKSNPKEALGWAECILEAMESRMRKNGIGTIGEVYDSSSPFFEGGCVSQAWSVAEVIRIKYLVDKYKNKEL